MDKNELKKALSRLVCDFVINDGAQFNLLQECIGELKSGTEVLIKDTALHPVSPAEGVPGHLNVIATQEQLDELKRVGGYVLETSQGSFIVLDGAIQLLMSRAEMSCELYKRMKQADNRDAVADLYNFGIAYAPDNATMKLGFIANLLQNAGSKQYQDRPQNEIFQDAEIILRASYPSMKLLFSEYTHDYTRAIYSLEQGNGSLMDNYKKTLAAAGYDDEQIKLYEPCISIITSDASKSSVIVKAFLKRGAGSRFSDYITFGDDQSERHYGEAATKKTFENNVNKAFANLKKNQERCVELMGIKLDYPEAVMTAIMEEGSEKQCLYNTCTKACDDILEQFSFNCESGVTSAFDVYMWLADMLNSSEMAKLKSETRIKADERVFRKLFSDYAKYDAPGPIRPRKRGKKAA